MIPPHGVGNTFLDSSLQQQNQFEMANESFSKLHGLPNAARGMQPGYDGFQNFVDPEEYQQ